jgi:hypothetical protein
MISVALAIDIVVDVGAWLYGLRLNSRLVLSALDQRDQKDVNLESKTLSQTDGLLVKDQQPV